MQTRSPKGAALARRRRLAARWALAALLPALVALAGSAGGAGNARGAGSAAGPAPLPPAPARWVTDGPGFLQAATRATLDAQLADFQRRTGHQVLVWIGPSPERDSIEGFAVRAFEAWGVGRKGHDDGLVIFVFADARKVRFEVGYGLEDRVPDAIASRIIGDVMAPRLLAGDPDGALTAGVAATLAAISPEEGARGLAQPGSPGEDGAQRARPSRPLSTLQIVLLGLAGLAFLLLLVTHPSLALWLLINILSRGRGGGGGGGGFSGGGGRSGGGGATGSW